MLQSEDCIRKDIVSPDGEREFQIRYIRNEQVGALTSRSGQSWFILDSMSFWYDLIQDEYPPRKKCSCKNDYFRLTFRYKPRIHTEDYRSVSLSAYCTSCGKEKKLGTVDIDSSPSAHLFTQPLTFCPEPKLKCKTYRIQGYWTEENLRDLTAFLLGRKPYLYCWYFDPADQKRYIQEITPEELPHYLLACKKFLSIFFAWEPLGHDQIPQGRDGRGVYVKDAVWRKREVIKLNCPITVWDRGYYHSMKFCSEYIDENFQVQPKSEAFSALVRDFQAYAKKIL